jgi:hypothetical protein
VVGPFSFVPESSVHIAQSHVHKTQIPLVLNVLRIPLRHFFFKKGLGLVTQLHVDEEIEIVVVGEADVHQIMRQVAIISEIPGTADKSKRGRPPLPKILNSKLSILNSAVSTARTGSAAPSISILRRRREYRNSSSGTQANCCLQAARC